MYQITEFDPPGPDGSALVTDLNGQGDVGGLSWTSQSGWQPLVWSQGGPGAVVAAPVGANVNAINNLLDVVGEYGPPAGGGYAPRFGYLSRGGVVTDFAQVLGTARSGAFDINDSGTVVGASGPDLPLPGALQVFRYHAGTGVVDVLGMPPGSVSAVATAISRSGLIAGFAASTDTGQEYGWIFDQAFRKLGSVFRPGAEGPLLVADVNDSGLVVGAMPIAGLSVGAFSLATADTSAQPVPIGTLPGYSASAALGVNQRGVVVGYCFDGGDERAFAADAGGLHDLNNALAPAGGWVLNRATAINDQGQIAGYGQLAGQQRGFLLTPVRSPADWQLYEMVSIILFGVIQDGGGVVVVPGGPPIPEPPWGWEQLPPAIRNVLIGAAFSRLSGLLPDQLARGQLEEAAIGMISRALGAMRQMSP